MAADLDLAELIGRVARELRNAPDVEHTLQRVVGLAADYLPGEVCASVSLVRGRRVETPVFSDERARHADQLQYAVDEGPCLDAIRRQETFRIDDMTTDRLYPSWARRVAAETDIRSSLSLQLFTDADSLGALNLYATHAHAFDDAEIRAEATVLAAQAAVALRSALNETDLRTALITRNMIGQAQGILMERHKLTAERAFRVLAQVSQERNIKLRDVAQHLVDTGEYLPS
jgi:GAF domain-containing protein